jgi:ATP-dependent DNA helicase RecQ
VPDALTVAQKIASCVVRLRESFGVGHVAAVLRGEDTARIRERGHNQLSTYGLLKGCTRHELREWVYQLMSQEFLSHTDDEYPVVRLGPRGRDLLRGTAEVRLRQPAIQKRDKGDTSRPARRTLTDDQPYDQSLFEVLRKWRREEASARGVPPYVIFSDRTLREVARARPTTLLDLRAIYGIGETKLEQFGSSLLQITRS